MHTHVSASRCFKNVVDLAHLHSAHTISTNGVGGANGCMHALVIAAFRRFFTLGDHSIGYCSVHLHSEADSLSTH